MPTGTHRILQDIAIGGNVSIDLEQYRQAGQRGGRMTLYATSELTNALRATLKAGSRDGCTRAHVNVVITAGRCQIPDDWIGSVTAFPGETFTLRVENHNAAASELYALVVFE